MIERLLLSKRLFLLGRDYAEQSDPVSAGIAISLFHDSLEVFLWHLIKDLDAHVKENAAFTTFFEAINSAPKNLDGKCLPLKAKILELNKARVGFKHYGNLPDVSEARKFKIYSEDFLVDSFKMFCSLDFNALSIVDLVPFDDVREWLRDAESRLSVDDLRAATEKISVAKTLLFDQLDQLLPKIDSNLSSLDRQFDSLFRRRIEGFRYIAEYLKSTRESTIVSMLGIPLRDYVILRRTLPTSQQTFRGERHFYHGNIKDLEEATIRKVIQIIASASLRAQSILG